MDLLPNENFPRIAACTPEKIKVEPGKIYSWCTCGLSEKQPFCNGLHNKIEGAPYKSMKVQFDKEEEVWLCRCKHTKTPPFCDGTHKTLKSV